MSSALAQARAGNRACGNGRSHCKLVLISIVDPRGQAAVDGVAMF